MEFFYCGRVAISINPSNLSRTCQLTAKRGFDLVMVSVPLDFRLNASEAGQHWKLSGLSLDLLVQGPGGESWLLGSGSLAEMLGSANQAMDLARSVDIRCSPRGLAQYEVFRDGGPVRLRCDVRGNICGFHNANNCLVNPSAVFGSMEIEWSRESWTGALGLCGLSTSVLVEIPLPLVGEGASDDGRKALLDAYEAFNHGGATAWKNSVGHIRPYLEAWIKREPVVGLEPKDNSDADRT